MHFYFSADYRVGSALSNIMDKEEHEIVLQAVRLVIMDLLQCR